MQHNFMEKGHANFRRESGLSSIQRHKEGDLTQTYDENPYTNRKFENQWTTEKRHQNLDYTTISDRLRTVSWSNNSHPKGKKVREKDWSQQVEHIQVPNGTGPGVRRKRPLSACYTRCKCSLETSQKSVKG